jgi:predicted methyltransferase
MSDFSNEGLKHRHLVQSKKINPWRKWYVKENIEIFPGEAVTLKKLQKTIY